MVEINRENIFESMRTDILNSNLNENDKKQMLQNIAFLQNREINILITGATGSGKSSTINALFDTDIAKVGIGVDPETMDIQKYTLKNLVLWDSPGLGDGIEADKLHAKNIIKKLTERDANGNALIDLVLVILDGSSRDLGTSYELINSVIIPNLGANKKDRILVAINQCDLAMKGKNWNHKDNKPEPKLVEFLDEKVQSVRRRIREDTGVDIEPIYYSAGYKESETDKQNPYNLAKLLYYILEHTPVEKRLVYVENLSKEPEVWSGNDKDYSKEIGGSLSKTMAYAAAGAKVGTAIGSIFGPTGAAFGKAVGGFLGGIFGWLFG